METVTERREMVNDGQSRVTIGKLDQFRAVSEIGAQNVSLMLANSTNHARFPEMELRT